MELFEKGKKAIAELGPKKKESLSREIPYIKWVTGFRAAMAEDNLTEGAFINFVDKLDVDTSVAKDKYDLLKVYYNTKLDKLIETKKKYDPTDFFNFEMSIPTSKPKPEEKS